MAGLGGWDGRADDAPAPWPESAEAAFYRGAVSLWGGGAELRFPVYSNPRRRPRPSLSYRVRGSRSA